MAWLATADGQLKKIVASFRPQRARWFEAYTPRDETVQTLEALAKTGTVELELDPKVSVPLDIAEVRDAVHEFKVLSGHYHNYWPHYDLCPTGLSEPPEKIARTALGHLNAWASRIDPVLAETAALQREADDLALLREYVTGSDESAPDLFTLAHPSGLLCKCMFCCPREQVLDIPFRDVLKGEFPRAAHHFFVVIGLPERISEIEKITAAHSCQRIAIPEWLPQHTSEQQARIDTRLEVIADGLKALQQRAETLKDDSGLAEALGNMALLEWYIAHVPATATNRKFCHVTGWTTDTQPRLQDILLNAGLHAILRFPPEPSGAAAPVRARELWWTQPFRVFTSMFGTPEENEIDPSGLLVLIVPLLYGYMFPDIGHGLVLVFVSAALYHHWRDGHFLVPCGIFAVFFGFVFGEFFGFEGAIAPLWVKPLAHPLDVLLAPLVFGVVLIILGLLLGGLEAFWRGQWRTWLLVEGAIPVLYAGSLGIIFDHSAGLIAIAALGWYYAGSLVQHRQHPSSTLLSATGALLESALRLGLNTVSFLRVGAFALGHAAFSAVIQELARHAANPVLYMLVIVIGNALLIAIEALLVFVQTTRLVLFEFFVRFLHAEGRVFKPLFPPVSRSQ